MGAGRLMETHEILGPDGVDGYVWKALRVLLSHLGIPVSSQGLSVSPVLYRRQLSNRGMFHAGHQ